MFNGMLIFYILLFVGGLVLIFLSLFGWMRFNKLKIGSQIGAILMTLLGVMLVVSGAVFAYRNIFIQEEVSADEVRETLESFVENINQGYESYEPYLTIAEYNTAPIDDLYAMYSPKGQSDIEAIVDGSNKSLELLLRNVGRKVEPGVTTTSLNTLSGSRIDLLDGQQRLLVFLTDSRYSVEQARLLTEYDENNPDGVEIVFIYPTITGSQVANLYSNNSDIGDTFTQNVVTRDSQLDDSATNLQVFALDELSITDVPAYIAIDENGITSLAAVGSAFKDIEELEQFFTSAFYTSEPLYGQIVNPNEAIDQTQRFEESEEAAGTDLDTVEDEQDEVGRGE